MMERFGIQEVYGMHNMPGLPVGDFAIRPGADAWPPPTMFTIAVTGRGGHAAQPHHTIDPVRRRAAPIVLALQSIVAAQRRPAEGRRRLGDELPQPADAFNVIPERVELRGTARTLDPRGAAT